MVENNETHTGLYRVTGRNPVFGHAPGDVFELTLSKAALGALIESGNIELHKGA